MSTYAGTDASETLWKIWDNNWTAFTMGDGNDTVITPVRSTSINYLFSGGDGNDHFEGDSGRDVAFGGNHDDELYGWGNKDTLDAGKGYDHLDGGTGDDKLYGGAQNDTLIGGDGADTMNGGTGRDYMWGGNGRDTYFFSIGDSAANSSQYLGADVIHNWNVDYDKIATMDGSYAEVNPMFFNSNIDNARYFVEHNSSLAVKDHVFVYGGTDGYLLSDLNGDGSFETGVILENRGHSYDFNSGNLV